MNAFKIYFYKIAAYELQLTYALLPLYLRIAIIWLLSMHIDHIVVYRQQLIMNIL